MDLNYIYAKRTNDTSPSLSPSPLFNTGCLPHIIVLIHCTQHYYLQYDSSNTTNDNNNTEDTSNTYFTSASTPSLLDTSNNTTTNIREEDVLDLIKMAEICNDVCGGNEVDSYWIFAHLHKLRDEMYGNQAFGLKKQTSTLIQLLEKKEGALLSHLRLYNVSS